MKLGDRVTVDCLWDSRHGESGTVCRIDDLVWVDFQDDTKLAAYDSTELRISK